MLSRFIRRLKSRIRAKGAVPQHIIGLRGQTKAVVNYTPPSLVRKTHSRLVLIRAIPLGSGFGG
jgi:hypothetical protein